jgi:enoyl-CoA hydratase
MTKDLILCDVHDGVATVTLNNPPLNLVTLDLTRQLDATLDRLATDPQVRVMILTGAGNRAFCAGSSSGSFLAAAVPCA